MACHFAPSSPSGPDGTTTDDEVCSETPCAEETRAGGTRHVAATRIDRWLSAARIFKSRSQAQDACEAGHVTSNGVTVKASRTVQVGDKISARAPRGRVVLVVLAIEEKRQGPVRARELYDDQSPPQDDETPMSGKRARGAGRPTKADRRAILRLTRSDPGE